ncbi:sensor histidine kinase [Motilimonas pumila]|uniref:histidine kinase n=1 Tax=Motilimonas pumila TaxID=2303987 RepID=A0A418YE46_9GAMM|nr:ATP-binding protein [Motilimonas pumila]RJG42778.1 hypothetical protein D1Z90_11860 [Motilimonas pumila]
MNTYSKVKTAVLQFLTTGVPTQGDAFLMRQLVLVKSFCAVCLVMLALFIGVNFMAGNMLMVLMEIATFVVISSALWIMSLKRNLNIPINIIVFVLFSFLVALPLIQQNTSYALIWTFFFPVFVVLLKGPKHGFILVCLYYACLLPIVYSGVDVWLDGQWDQQSFIRYCAASVVMVYCSFFNEISLKKSYLALLKAQENEKRIAREHANTMIQILDKRNEMLTDISHELRTPLSVIKLHLEMIEDGVASNDSYQLLHGKLAEIDRLISGLHEITLADMGDLYIKKHPVYIYSTIKQSLDAYAALIQNHNLQLNSVIHFSPQLQIDVDEERIMQVLANIFQNAIRYTDPGGQVVFSAIETNDAVIISVADSAPGVPDQALSQLCDRLYRVDASRSKETGGVGIGLSICRSIVSAHKGYMSVQHSALGGIEVTVSLPKSCELGEQDD